jgi:signal transduction histidine kinase
VEKHGGTLTVNSSLGQGSEFVICIPVWAVRSRSLAQLALPRNYDIGY